jgi:catechol 2,3-dioxygenase-like lactoylglutathione lyase family enzyme
MAQTFTGIDHCMIVVRDLDAAAARYRRLGFALTPRGVHSSYMGTGNHCIMFQQDYLELLGVLTATDANIARLKSLERDGEGLKELALAGPSADAAREAFAAAELDPLPAIEFSRPVELTTGTREAKFRVTRLPHNRLPGLNLFMCQHYTRNLVWLPQYQQHANGVRAVAGLVIAVADPPAAAAPYARLLGASVVKAAGGGVKVGINQTKLRFVTPATLAEQFPNVRFRSLPAFVAVLELITDDPEQAAAQLTREAVPHVRRADGAVEVPPEEACGVLIRFQQARGAARANPR